MKRKLIALPLVLAAGLAFAIFLSGRPQTDDANQLVSDTSNILTQAGPKVEQADNLLNQAFDQQSQSQLDAEKATLSQSLAVINEINGDLSQAKANMEQAASLDVSQAYRDYLQAESRSIGYTIDVNNTRLAIANLLVADPTLNQPGSEQKLADLKKTSIDQSNAAKQAEDEANSIADQHPDEIK